MKEKSFKFLMIVIIACFLHFGYTGICSKKY